jgi:hypothetical protein
MILSRQLKHLAAALAMAGIVAQSSEVLTAGPVKHHSTPLGDVSLGESGQVLNADGAAQAGVAVTLQQQAEPIATATTDLHGKFAFKGLGGGMYLVSTTGAAGAMRAWVGNTAPPAAAEGVLLVRKAETLRGQNDGLIGTLVSSPGALIVIGGAAAIIAFAVDSRDAS